MAAQKSSACLASPQELQTDGRLQTHRGRAQGEEVVGADSRVAVTAEGSRGQSRQVEVDAASAPPDDDASCNTTDEPAAAREDTAGWGLEVAYAEPGHTVNQERRCASFAPPSLRRSVGKGTGGAESGWQVRRSASPRADSGLRGMG